MPIFAYECTDCVRTFEELRPTDDRDLPAHCPHCDKEGERLVGYGVKVHLVTAFDGTKRFDNVRKFRATEKAYKAETDKTQKAKLKAEMNRLSGKES